MIGWTVLQIEALSSSEIWDMDVFRTTGWLALWIPGRTGTRYKSRVIEVPLSLFTTQLFSGPTFYGVTHQREGSERAEQTYGLLYGRPLSGGLSQL